jgi:hypothetical protein
MEGDTTPSPSPKRGKRRVVKEENADKIVAEFDVYLSQTLVDKLCLFQFPLKPPNTPYDFGKVEGMRIKPLQKKLELNFQVIFSFAPISLSEAVERGSSALQQRSACETEFAVFGVNGSLAEDQLRDWNGCKRFFCARCARTRCVAERLRCRRSALDTSEEHRAILSIVCAFGERTRFFAFSRGGFLFSPL